VSDLIKREDVLREVRKFRLSLGAGGGIGIAGAHNAEMELGIGGPLLDAIEDAIAALPAEPADKPMPEWGGREPEDFGHNDCAVCDEARRRKIGGWFDPNSHGRGGI